MDRDFCLSTDAAGSVGFAAVWKSHWCAASWPASWKNRILCRNIVLLEQFAIVVSLEIWGEFFANRRLLFSTHNRGVLFAVNCLSSKSQPVICLLRYLVYTCLCLNIWNKAKYIPGKVNEVADALLVTDGAVLFPSTYSRSGWNPLPVSFVGAGLVCENITKSLASSS